MPNLLARARAGRLAGRAAFAWALILASTGSVLAQVEHAAVDARGAAGEHSGAGLPQLDPATFAPQLVWLAIAFAALYFLMTKVALPKVGQVLEERQERISADLDRAQSLRDEADTVMAAYEKALADARAQAQALMAETAAAVAGIQSERQNAFASDLAAKTRAAEERIAAAKDRALAGVRSVSAEIAQAAAEKLGGVKVDAAEADAAVGDQLDGQATAQLRRTA